MGNVKMVNCHYQQNNCTSESYKNRSVFIIISEKDYIKWINKKHNLYRLLSRISFLHINYNIRKKYFSANRFMLFLNDQKRTKKNSNSHRELRNTESITFLVILAPEERKAKKNRNVSARISGTGLKSLVTSNSL